MFYNEHLSSFHLWGLLRVPVSIIQSQMSKQQSWSNQEECEVSMKLEKQKYKSYSLQEMSNGVNRERERELFVVEGYRLKG